VRKRLLETGLGVALVSCALAAYAADREPKPAPKIVAQDLDFLEYLGTLESDEENWTDIAVMNLTDVDPTPTETAQRDSKLRKSTSKAGTDANVKPEVGAKSADSEKKR
jgi:hypothetical protein